MQRFLIALLASITLPALAMDWGRYDNSRFGYSIDIPPGFSESAPEPTNRDGRVFATADGMELRIWGANVLEGFPVEFDAMVSMAVSNGWEVSIPAGFTADAAFEGQKDGQRVIVHAIEYCGGALMAAFQLSYATDQQAEMLTIIPQLSRSLKLAPGFMCP